MGQFFSQFSWVIVILVVMVFVHRLGRSKGGAGGCCGGGLRDYERAHEEPKQSTSGVKPDDKMEEHKEFKPPCCY